VASCVGHTRKRILQTMENKETDANAKPLVATKLDNKLYLYNGKVGEDYEFKNLVDGKSGVISKAKANRVFNFPLALNTVVLKHQSIIDLLKIGGFKIDVMCDGVHKRYFTKLEEEPKKK